MQKHDEAVVRLITRIGELMELGLRPEWLSPDVRPYVKAAVSLHMRERTISPLAVRLLATNSGSEWDEIGELFGVGGVDPKDAVASALSANVMENFRPLYRKIRARMEREPDTIGRWLPAITREMNELSRRGSVYDPTPGAHFKKAIPQVAHHLSAWMNYLLRGGLYSGSVGIISSAPSGGKSTMAYTIAGEAVRNRVKNVLITGEELEQGVVARTLMAQTQLEKDAVVSFQRIMNGEDAVVTTREYDLLKEALDDQNQYLRIYNYEALDIGRMSEIVAWERPGLLQIDHLLLARDPRARSTGNTAFDLGDIIYAIQRMTVQQYAIQTLVYSQLPEITVKKLKAGEMPKHATFYGSGMINQAAHWSSIIFRHPKRRGWSRWWYIKDKAWDRDSDVYAVEHDPRSHCFIHARTESAV